VAPGIATDAPPDRLDMIARAVALVAAMPLSDDDRAGVLDRVIEDMTKGQRRTGGYYPGQEGT
jgi:hypothetical protein